MILSNPKSAIMALLLSVATRPGITAAERKLNLRNGSSRSRALSPDQEADEPVLGSSNQENPQAIVGGELVTQGDYPYFGSILEFEGGWVTFCGGALIAPDIVLTAAHCTDDIDLDLTKVYFNSTTFNSGLERTFSQCTRHPEYGVAVSLDYDYALCKLDQPVTTIQPIEIDNGETDLNENTEFLIMGHGKIEFGGAMSWDLLDTTVQYIDNTDCGVLYDTEITDAMICAGIPDVGGQDSCQGDSGGPMVLRKFNFDGTHKDVHVGVVSWGTGCAEAEHPGVYARTGHAYNWIVDTMCRKLGSESENCESSSVSPTPAPTSESTSLVPTFAPSDMCLSSSPARSGRFNYVGNNNANGKEKNKSCRWLGKQDQEKKDKICCYQIATLNLDGTDLCPEFDANGNILLVKDRCGNKCNIDCSPPSNAPSSSPTLAWTESPSNIAGESLGPLPDESLVPIPV